MMMTMTTLAEDVSGQFTFTGRRMVSKHGLQQRQQVVTQTATVTVRSTLPQLFRCVSGSHCIDKPHVLCCSGGCSLGSLFTYKFQMITLSHKGTQALRRNEQKLCTKDQEQKTKKHPTRNQPQNWRLDSEQSMTQTQNHGALEIRNKATGHTTQPKSPVSPGREKTEKFERLTLTKLHQ